MILPAPALTESLTNELSADMQDIYQQAAALGSASARSSSSSVADESLTQSLMMVNTPPTEQQQEQQQQEQEKQQDKEQAEASRQTTKYRILTIHLEKEREGMEWAVPVSKGWKSDLDIDVTSAYHLGGWFETRMADYQVIYIIVINRRRQCEQVLNIILCRMRSVIIFAPQKETILNP